MARVVDLYPQKTKKTPLSPGNVRIPVFSGAPVRTDIVPAVRDVPCHRLEPAVQQWFTRTQLCRKMGISSKALQHLLVKERLPYVDIAGETYFDPADVGSLMNALKRQHYPPTL